MKFRRWIAALLALGMAVGFCACAEKQEPSQAPAEETAAVLEPVSVSDLITPVTEENRDAYDFTEKTLDYLTLIDENYPSRSISNKEVHDAFGDWLISELKACGYAEEQIEEQVFLGGNVYGVPVKGRNIILTVPGQTEAGQIIVGAHYDGYGLGDNGSGVALLLATAAGLAHTAPQLTIRYIFFDAEEVGLVGSKYYAEHMTDAEIASTYYMVNLDTLVFGDFCCIYGGVYGYDYDEGHYKVEEGTILPEPEHTEGYDFAADTAESLGFRVYRSADLDGYFETHGEGMAPEDAFFTNPWTNAHPAPMNMWAQSPATFGASDHAGFAVRGIPYIFFEATNWWAEGLRASTAFTGYTETYDTDLGDGGQFLHTEYDTLETLDALFPGRAEKHYRLFSPLLSALLLAGPIKEG